MCDTSDGLARTKEARAWRATWRTLASWCLAASDSIERMYDISDGLARTKEARTWRKTRRTVTFGSLMASVTIRRMFDTSDGLARAKEARAWRATRRTLASWSLVAWVSLSRMFNISDGLARTIIAISLSKESRAISFLFLAASSRSLTVSEAPLTDEAVCVSALQVLASLVRANPGAVSSRPVTVSEAPSTDEAVELGSFTCSLPESITDIGRRCPTRLDWEPFLVLDKRTADTPSGMQLARVHNISNTLPAFRWPWV